MKKSLLTFAVASAAALTAFGQNILDVDVRKPGSVIQPTMYGIFFEDINYAADGGLYGELVKNRSFEFPQHLMGWQAFGCVEVKDDGPFGRCPHYVVLTDPGHRDRRTGLVNEGYFGIGLTKGAQYRFSVWAKAPKTKATIRVQLIDESSMAESQVLAEQKVDITSPSWVKYTATLSPSASLKRGKLRIYLHGPNSVCLEHVSLFPVDTYKNRENGMRRDLAQALEDLHPGIFRFPGGCIVEGTDLETRYQWKNSVGPVENRPLNQNRWEHTFDHRYFPDYYQSYGLGFFEFFQLAEDIGAEPLPVISCGLSCQFQNPNPTIPGVHVAVDDLGPYIQDALDLVEFANGDATTTWGKVRADMGHPEPFNLKFLAVGNEQWDYDEKHGGFGPVFTERPKKFSDAIRAKYPALKLIGTTGPNSEGWDFDLLQPRMKELKVDLYDEHYYRNEEWFLSHGLRYDSYDRKGPKVFAGEYACHGRGKKWNHYEAAILEAAHMTGFERNADIVHMTTPAPLFAHVDGWQWRPDQIWYDQTQMFKTTSYYVQQMYATNRGTNVLRLTMPRQQGKKTVGVPVANQEGQNGLFATAAYDQPSGDVIIKVVNTSKTVQPVILNLNGIAVSGTARTLTLSHQGMDDENSIQHPGLIVPRPGTIGIEAGKKQSVINDLIPAMSFVVYRVGK